MSKIIRHFKDAPTVYVGGKQLNFEYQSKAESELGNLFPLVTVMTDPDGAKFIPIEEIFKIQKDYHKAEQVSHKEGFREGHEAGLAEGLKKAQEVLQQFDGAIKDAIDQRHVLLEEAKQKVLQLVIQISRKVTFDAITIEPEATIKMISGVIDTLLDRSRLKVRVNPDHLPIVEQGIDTFLKGSTTIKEITVAPDPRVRYGGCFIETPTGDIDARLESQFEIIEEALGPGEV